MEQHGGGHLDLGKRPESSFLMLFIPVLCCIMGSGRYQVWWERKGNWLMLVCSSFNYCWSLLIEVCTVIEICVELLDHI